MNHWQPPTMLQAMEMAISRQPNESEGDYLRRWEKTAKEDAATIISVSRPGDAALEFGCGMGRLLRELRTHFGTLWGVDSSPQMLRLARDYLQDDGIGLHSSLEEIPENYFDFCWAIYVFQHLEHREAFLALRRIAHCLSGKGRLWFNLMHLFPAFSHFEKTAGTSYPLFFYTLNQLEFILGKAGFTPVFVKEVDEYFQVLAAKASS